MGNVGRIKVLGFDAWTRGAHHYQRLVQACENQGIHLLLVHLGSLGDEKGRPSTEVIGDLEVRDIRHYSNRSFVKVIESEDPAAVIFLSTTSFAHRAFLRYCRQRGIPTVHLAHGVQLAYEDHAGVPSPRKIIARAWALRRLLTKHVRYFWPIYARALLETGASLGEWRQFARDILGRARGIVVPARTARDSKTAKALVYIDAEADVAVERYGYSESEVVAVGNPDLIDFGVTPDMIGSCLEVAPTSTHDVMYIETAWTDYGKFFFSDTEYLSHIVATRDELLRQGRHLLFKPHPLRHNSRLIVELARARVEICASRDFASKLQGCCACIVEPSSAALIPALMGLPLFLAAYGALDSRDFGKLLRGYPRAVDLFDVSDFSVLLSRERIVHKRDSTRAWISRHTGPLPAQLMPERVVAMIKALIADRC